MKHFFYLIFLLICPSILAQKFDVVNLRISGDVDKRINLVILSEGYQSSELDQFITDATNFMNDMFSQSPFKEYTNYFNVYAIKVPSNESGADHPGTATDEASYSVPTQNVDTYFNTSYDSFNFHRFLYTFDNAAIMNVLANNFPIYDQALILVNSPYYGGTGGEFPITSLGTSASEIAIHELGHSLFDLKDEYYDYSIFFEEGINMTQETNPLLVKWKNWIDVNGIGIYPYASTGTASTWNRPHQTCKMRYLGYPFCSVCKQGIIEKIHSLVSPIVSYTPLTNTIENHSFPIDFHLNLIEPSPNTLHIMWTLNDTEFATNVDDVTLYETDLESGTNSLSIVVTDKTELLKVDDHDTFHVYTVTWTIDNTALGIKEISSEINDISISLYPNPTNSILNLKFESSLKTNLKVDIIGMDGKKIKSAKLSDDGKLQINLDALSQGIYLAKFYANTIFIGQKKLIKN